MLIGLDGIPLTEQRTGVGNYTSELARALAAARPADEFELIAPKPYSEEISLEARPRNLRTISFHPHLIGRRWWAIGLPSYLRRNAIALFHGTNFEVPLRGQVPAVMTIHDLSLLRHSSMHAARAVWRSRLRLPLMTRKATMIITPSDSVRDEVCEHLNIDRSRVTAIPLAPSARFKPLKESETAATLERLSIEDRFLLFVGTIEPRKNLLTLIRAFEELLRTTELRPQLVIAGKMGWKTNEFRSYIGKSPGADRIRVTGYLSNEELRALYSSCSAFVYPSIHEGFGLPPLEAMACGASVIATRVPSLMTASQTVARIVSAENVNDITAALVELLSDKGLRDTLKEGGLLHAAGFSWDRTAALTSAVYEEAMKRAKR